MALAIGQPWCYVSLSQLSLRCGEEIFPKASEAETEISGFSFWLAAALVVTTAACAGVWSFGRHFGNQRESIYLLDRLGHFAAGQQPFRDFEFAYGPLMLGLPAVLAKVTGADLMDAYYASVTLGCLLGVLAMWTTVRVVTRGSGHGLAIFYLLFLTFLPFIFSVWRKLYAAALLGCAADGGSCSVVRPGKTAEILAVGKPNLHFVGSDRICCVCSAGFPLPGGYCQSCVRGEQ